MLTDFDRLPQWTTFLRVHSGRPVAGTRLTISITPPGSRPMRFSPTVLRAAAPHELRWLGRVGLPGIFDGEHFFEIAADRWGSRVRHGETFRDLLVPFVMTDRALAATRAGFEAFNAGLKQRAEEISSGVSPL